MNILITTVITTKEFLPYGELMEDVIENKFNSEFDFELLITDNVDINDYNWITNTHYKIIPYYELKNQTDWPQYKSTINKFYTLTFEEYDRVVFIDADMLLIEHPDFIIKMAIMANPNASYINEDQFSTPQFIVKPNKELFDSIISHDILSASRDNIVVRDNINSGSLTLGHYPGISCLNDTGLNKYFLNHIDEINALINMPVNEYVESVRKIRKYIYTEWNANS